MRRSFLYKVIAFSLALAFTGCQAYGAAALPSRTAREVAEVSTMEAYPFAEEVPPIGDNPDFRGSVEPSVSGMSIRKAPSEVKSVWISFLEMQNMLTKKTESEFRSNMRTAFGNIKDFGLNTVVIQVRPYADAFYKSAYFPWSFLITGIEGQDPGFDPFAIMVEEARAKGLRIEAWVNPYRIRPADRKDALCATNQAKIWLDSNDDAVIKYNGVTSYNPASLKAQNLIVSGIVELVRNYDIDAVHIDDYFYPTTDKGFDMASYQRYLDIGGRMTLANWRRANVETLIKKIYAAVKKENPDVLFGISPQSSLDNNYNAHYLDVEKIASNTGYCDYICPQIYFGFENAAQPYSATLEMWNKMVTAPGVKLYVGIAAYKVGSVDSWAGEGKNEWVNNSNLLKRMTQEARLTNRYGGIVLYRYDFLFNPAPAAQAIAKREAANLKTIL